MLQDEAALLRRAQAGDDEAFGRLVEPCLDRVYRLALRILADAAEAEDAVQEALCKAWRALPEFRGEARFLTWLYRIVWRVSVDRARTAKPLLLDEGLAGAEQPHEADTGWFDPERRLEGMEARRVVAESLRQLPAPYRAALTLYYIDGLAVREIAQVLDMPVNTVKTHLHRARLALKKELQARLEDPGAGGRKKE